MLRWATITSEAVAAEANLDHQYRSLKKEQSCRLAKNLYLEINRHHKRRPFTLWARGKNFDFATSWGESQAKFISGDI